MEKDESRNAEAEEQVSIWGIRRKLLKGYFVTFSASFLLVSGVAAWLTYTPITGIKGTAELAMSAMGLASERILWLAAFSIITVEVGNMIVEYLIVDRYNKAKKDGFKEGEAGERSRWQAWYERMQAAQQEGRPFDEPPPGGQEHKR